MSKNMSATEMLYDMYKNGRITLPTYQSYSEKVNKEESE